jgi:UDP-N-acetyl-D-mannosaminuronic acid dehydrogenase
MERKRVCVVGLGYIGLPTAALLASSGYDVAGTDVNASVVETINRGSIHIVEPDLDAFVRAGVVSGRLKAYSNPQPANVYMLCVPTPFHEGGAIPQPNIDYVMAAAKSVAPLVKAGDLVILESTSPVGTTQKLGDLLAAHGADLAQVHVAYCPERVLPGRIMVELLENDRVVGGLTAEATQAVKAFYSSFVRGEVLESDAKTAEMCKLVENSFRDVNIAFANELSMLCDRAGINVWRLIELANRHPRVNIMQPGAGVGGHCIAVDPWFIVASDPENSRLIRAGREVNRHKAHWVLERVRAEVARLEAELGRKPRVGCFGLAFKPDIDDLRESPAVEITQNLLASGFDVVAVEPNIAAHVSIPLASMEDAARECDLSVLLVKHRQFRQAAQSGAMGDKPVLDFCGVLE